MNGPKGPHKFKRGAENDPREHHPDWCGFAWETTCDDCRFVYWPVQCVSDERTAHPPGPPIPEPTIKPEEVIAAMHHWRASKAMRRAIWSLIRQDVAKLVLALIEDGTE